MDFFYFFLIILKTGYKTYFSIPLLVNCPAPLKPRDFVLMRSWLDTGPGGEAMLISKSVEHRDYPPKKGFIRATSYLTGFVLRPRGPGSCILSYVTHCDPQGALPPWLVNKVTHTFGPRMIKDLQKAAVGYLPWKTERNLYWKPWRFPEQIDKPRISIEEVCGKGVRVENCSFMALQQFH